MQVGSFVSIADTRYEILEIKDDACRMQESYPADWDNTDGLKLDKPEFGSPEWVAEGGDAAISRINLP